MPMKRRHFEAMNLITAAWLIIIVSAVGPPVLAQDGSRTPIKPEGEPALNTSSKGWGPRVGVGFDPDQIIGGVHWDVGRFTPHLRLVPNMELGLGDDHTILSVTVPLHYVFRDVDVNFFPYVGGGLTLGLVNHDPPGDHDDDDDIEGALRGIGGMEWRWTEKTDFFTEANVVFGDVHDLQLMAGWTFRR